MSRGADIRRRRCREATVDTISFGTPTGRARIAGVTSAVPPDPPSPISPATSSRARQNRSNATAIAATDRPRSLVNTAAAPSGWCAATSRAGTSAAAALALGPEIDQHGRHARGLDQPLHVAQLVTLRVAGAGDIDPAARHCASLVARNP